MKKVFMILIILQFYAVTNILAQSANINSVFIQPQTREYRNEGIMVHVNFNVQGLKNKFVIVQVSFFNSDRSQMISLNGRYDDNGQVAIYSVIRPQSDYCDYDDFKLFLPYDAFAYKQGTNDYYCTVCIHSDRQLASGFYQFLDYFKASHDFAKIDNVRVEQNYQKNNKNGINIHLDLKVVGLKNRQGKVHVELFDTDKKTKILHQRSDYWVTSKYETSLFNDLQIFVPYNDIKFKEGYQKYYIYLEYYSYSSICPEGGGELCGVGFSDYIPFSYKFEGNIAANYNSNQSNATAFNKGVELFRAGKYSEAIPYFEKLANQGHVDSQYNLALCYYNLENYSAAVKWFENPVNKGDASAQSSLGVCYQLGLGVTQNYYKAFELFQKSAKQGDAEGQFRLGSLYYQGLGCSKDISQAKEWFQKAANQGHAKASFILNSIR